MDAAAQNLLARNFSSVRSGHGVELSAIAREATAAFLSVFLMLAAAFLLARRTAGALIEPLSAVSVVVVGIFATAACALIALLCRDDNSPRSSFRNIGWSKYAAHVSLPLIGLAICLPGSSIAGVALLWLLIVGEEVWGWRRRSNSRTADLVPSAIRTPKPTASFLTESWPIEASPSVGPAVLDWSDASVSQQLIYRTGEDGRMIVEGWLRVALVPEQQIAIMHVAFCPAFTGMPRVEAEAFDGPECEIRPTLVLPWGVRWELKLASPAPAAATIVLGFFAGETANSDSQ